MTTRLTMPSAMPAELAERGSDTLYWPTAAEQAIIEWHAAQRIAAVLTDDKALFIDVLGDCYTNIAEHLQRAFREVEKADRGDVIAMTHLTQWVHAIQLICRRQAEAAYLEQFRDEASTEVLGKVEA